MSDFTDAQVDQIMRERDEAEEKANDLAACIAALLEIDIGEHSNMNCPWQNAIDAAEDALAHRDAPREPAAP